MVAARCSGAIVMSARCSGELAEPARSLVAETAGVATRDRRHLGPVTRHRVASAFQRLCDALGRADVLVAVDDADQADGATKDVLLRRLAGAGRRWWLFWRTGGPTWSIPRSAAAGDGRTGRCGQDDGVCLRRPGTAGGGEVRDDLGGTRVCWPGWAAPPPAEVQPVCIGYGPASIASARSAICSRLALVAAVWIRSDV
jgi:hypothetical protein